MSSKQSQEDLEEERARDNGCFIRSAAPVPAEEPAAPIKDKMLFYLGRHLRAAEERAAPNYADMARQGKNMAERRVAADNSHEAIHEEQALRAAFNFIRDNFPDKP